MTDAPQYVSPGWDPFNTMPSISTKISLDSVAGENILGKQIDQAGKGLWMSFAGKAIDSIAQTILGILQIGTIGKAYDAQTTISGHQKAVAEKAIELEGKRSDNGKEVQIKYLETQQEKDRMERNMQLQLASIHERGKDNRASLYVANQAFYGNPEKVKEIL
ncbi:MAG: hypothetical protein HY540_03045 [Deltaproteobacteria bacterium]|nr:hypothetical protein [Deltaproteobacteria bacterium]